MADSFKVMVTLWSGLFAVIAITCDCEFYAVFSEYKAKKLDLEWVLALQ